VEDPFDICALAETAGATYVARWTTAKPKNAKNAIKEALDHKGFALVEILTQCPTHFGRRALSTGDAVASLQWLKDTSVSQKKAAEMGPLELESKFVLGKFVHKERPIFQGSSIYPKVA